MPRRLPVRPAKVFGNFFVLIVLTLMSFIYYVSMGLVYGPRVQQDERWIPFLIFYNFLFLMLLWSFFQTMTTDPGQVPVFWGFHLGDNENKRRRYCLMCNVFKPERCHHCSACNRCVLNMDHHCPWINNCVGFWNRKYFLLLLIYVLIITYVTAISLAYDFYEAIMWGYNNKMFSTNSPELGTKIMVMLGFVLNFIVVCLMTAFLKFHVMLASDNKTTIENLDKMGKPFKSPYDVGKSKNWKQIFGNNPWMYPFPIFCDSGKPIGDGIYWPTIQSEQELAQRQSQQAAERAAQSQVVQANQNMGSNSGSQQFIIGQQYNRGGQQNFPPGMVMQNQQQMNNNVQMIGPNDNNMIMINQGSDSNSKRDLNQRIFQNQGRAYQLQQQLQQQNQQMPAYRGGNQLNQNPSAGSGGHNSSRGGAQGSSGMVNPKKRRAAGQPDVSGQGQNRFRR